MPLQPTTPGVYVQDLPTGSTAITPAPTAITAFLGRTLLGPSDSPTSITSFGDFQLLFGDLATGYPLGYAVQGFFANGGSEAIIVRLSATLPGDPNARTGLYSLDNTDTFNILCVPPDDITASDGGIPSAFWGQAAAYCAQRRAMLLAEPPQAWADHARNDNLNQIQPTGLGIFGNTARNAAVYFPRVYIPDPLSGNKKTLSSACGIIAGIWAATDAIRGVWNAPAGVDTGLAGISGLEFDFNGEQNGLLNSLGINSLRTFPVTGPVIWGGRTLRGADQFEDEFRYIHVRRLALFIEESLHRGTAWTVFAPNDDALWSQLSLSVTTFLQSLFQKGAFVGDTASTAFFVRCDASTTTSADINNGIVNITIGFAPLKPAEFIVLNIAQRAALPTNA